MREIVSPLSGIRSPFGGRVDPYKVLGFRPTLVADMTRDYFRSTSRQTFDDLFTHSRLGNATMVDSDGLLKWAPHNLLTYSEDFSNSAWTKSGCTISANAITAPDGSLTADEVIPDTTSLSVIKPYNIAGTYTANIWVKDGGRGACAVAMGSGAIGYLININLTDGSYISGRSYGGGVLVGYNISDAGSGWYLVSVTATANVGGVSVVSGDGVSSSSGIYIWGAHLYRSDLGGMAPVPADARVAGSETYVPTTSTAKYLPRRHHHVYNGTSWVDKGTLIETEARTNLFPYNTPNAANWATINATLTEGAAFGFGGQLTASRLTGSGVVATQRTGLNASATGNACCSFRVRKDATHSFVQILQGSDTTFFQNFDLSAGSLGTSGAGVVNSGILDEGDFWLIFMAINIASSSAFYIYLAQTSSATYGQASDASGYIDIDHAQVEPGLTPSSTIPTSGSTVTRAADTSGLTIPAAKVPWPTPNVIGEELVTNGDFGTGDLTGWIDASFGTGTAVYNSGGVDLTRVDVSNEGQIRQSVTTIAGSVYEVSYDRTSGTNGRLWIGTGTTGGDRLNIGEFIPSGTNNTVFFRASSATTYLLFNVGANGVTVRFDNISVKEIDPLAVSIQMEGRMTYADEDTTGNARWYYWYKDANNFISNKLATQSTYTGGIYPEQKANGAATNGVIESSPGSYSPGVLAPFNIASRHGSNFINGAVDGTALTASTTPVALPDLSATDLELGYDFMGCLRIFRMWPVDITDTGLEGATT